MTTSRQLVTAVTAFAVFAAFCGTAHAQASAESFGAISGRLAAAERPVSVTTGSGATVKGKLLDLSESSLTVLVGSERTTLQKSEILEVRELRRHAGKGALIGLGIGGALGFVGALAGCDCGDEALGFALAGAIAYGGIGAGVGALAGAATTTGRVVYRAPARTGDAKIALSPIVAKRGAGIAAALRF